MLFREIIAVILKKTFETYMVNTLCREYAELSILMQLQNITPVLSKGCMFVIGTVFCSAYCLLQIQYNLVITCNNSIA